MTDKGCRKGQLLYRNPLTQPSDFEDFIPEGEVNFRFDDGLILSSKQNEKEHGEYAHFLLWLKEDFPDRILIEWTFTPLEEPGLCMFFFAAKGINGEDLFDPSLKERQGYYPEYHSSDINTYHLSYFRRKWEEERAFHTVNLRKSSGFHLVSQGADPLPDIADCKAEYKMMLVKDAETIRFFIDGLKVLDWVDDGITGGPILKGGKIGFRQMAPMKAKYRDLAIYRLK